MTMRNISSKFKEDLTSGILAPILEAVKNDNTLALCIRNGYVNIYYRGGNLVKITEKEQGYTFHFDTKYAKPDIATMPVPALAQDIDSRELAATWTDSFPLLKQLMDNYFTRHEHAEREFQQVIVRENNYSKISNSTEYFIADIEMADKEQGSRFDIVACKWEANQRGSGKVKLALMEMKYGDGALGGDSGIRKHFDDISAYLANPEKREALIAQVQEQINILHSLKLIRHTRTTQDKKAYDSFAFTVDPSEIEVCFVIANHNPRSETLWQQLVELKKHIREAKTPGIQFKFFVSTTCGYAMHTSSMLDIDAYMELLTVLGANHDKQAVEKN